jgi:hypothetical protein
VEDYGIGTTLQTQCKLKGACRLLPSGNCRMAPSYRRTQQHLVLEIDRGSDSLFEAAPSNEAGREHIELQTTLDTGQSEITEVDTDTTWWVAGMSEAKENELHGSQQEDQAI